MSASRVVSYDCYSSDKVDFSAMVWRDYDIVLDTEKKILAFCKDEYHLYDSDNAGEETIYVGVRIESEYSFYKVSHEWFWDEYESDGERGRYLHNNFWVESIEDPGIPKDRSWYFPVARSHPDRTNWPPVDLSTYKPVSFSNKIR